MSAAQSASLPRDRVMAIDALRGFDMFWIIGGREVVLGLLLLLANPLPDAVTYQFKHTAWIGFSFWDLIMPLFLFITGASMPFSFAKRLEPQGGKGRIYAKILRRTVILFVLGMAAQGNLLDFDLSRLHLYCNTLQAIAAGYLVAAILLLHVSVAWQIATTAALLVAYWALLRFVPVPGHGVGVIEPSANLALYVDTVLLGRFRDGTAYTWILSSMTFAASVLLGVMAGHVLRSQKPASRKLLWLVGAGIGCLAGGAAWASFAPIIKHIWSSSMVLWAAGWSYLLLAAFYAVIDVAGFRAWAFPLVVIGMNAIAVYMGTHLVNVKEVSDHLAGGLARHAGSAQDLVRACGGFGLVWLILLYMYRKRTFLRV